MIKTALQKGCAFLTQLQRKDGAISDTINPLFETWETILAAKSIFRCDSAVNETAIKKALAFLQSNENNEGLICHNRKCKAAYCLETTAEYITLLKLTGNTRDLEPGLQKIAAMQKQTGDWDIGNPDVTRETNFPSVTAFIVNLFNSTGSKIAGKQKAINWLLHKQTAKGHWGSAWEYYGCTGYALWQVLQALKHENSKETKMAIDKAIAFIKKAQRYDGSWLEEEPFHEKHISAQLQTALMLASLQCAGIKEGEVIDKGISFLINSQQPDGSWDGGFFPIPEKRYTKQEYVFATALAIEVLQNYRLNKGI